MRDTEHSLYTLAYMSRSRLDGDTAIVRREIELLLARAGYRKNKQPTPVVGEGGGGADEAGSVAVW